MEGRAQSKQRQALSPTTHGVTHRAVLWLLAAALFLGGLVPTGFMPTLAQADDGSGQYLTMVICTADGEHTITLDADGNVVDPDDIPGEPEPTHRDSLCAFALTGPLLAPTDLGVTVLPVATADAVLPATGDRLLASANRQPQARGPPRA